jgi:type II secretory pathway predicted ATPase ExeA
MYRAFYSLAKEPFAKDIRPQDHFPSRSFQEALARMRYLVDTRGFGALVGESGAGKTYALRTLAEGLNPALYKVIYLPLASGTAMDMYRSLTAGLGEEPRFRKSDLFRQIQRTVEHLFHEKRVTPVLILDELHLARADFLTDLAMIGSFAMDSRNPFVCVLAGLPLLSVRLRLNQTQPLAQRIIVHYKLEPLDKDEVGRYLGHHLRLAGAVTPVFTEPALEAIASNSGGWPRLVGNLARTALLLGAQLKQNPIDADTVRQAAQETSL